MELEEENLGEKRGFTGFDEVKKHRLVDKVGDCGLLKRRGRVRVEEIKFFFFFGVMLGIEPRASCVLNKCSISELHSPAQSKKF